MVMPRSRETWPSSGSSWPEIIRKSVVLPAPFGPTRPIFSPFWRAAEASMKRIWWPTCLLTLSRRIIFALAWKIVAPLLFHVARWRKSVPDSQAIRFLAQSEAFAFRASPAANGLVFVWGLNRPVACADREIVQPWTLDD